ncbi:uncharacterized protein TNCV_4898211 [Trichonephila clavipes]|nr:uncharacterized protein TNCV_4898211 [Trichonephila clavipes]
MASTLPDDKNIKDKSIARRQKYQGNHIIMLLGVAFLGFWTVRTVLNPISGQVFGEGHDESGVLHSARWHDGDWMVDGKREAWLRLDVEYRKVFDLAESLVTAL